MLCRIKVKFNELRQHYCNAKKNFSDQRNWEKQKGCCGLRSICAPHLRAHTLTGVCARTRWQVYVCVYLELRDACIYVESWAYVCRVLSCMHVCTVWSCAYTSRVSCIYNKYQERFIISYLSVYIKTKRIAKNSCVAAGAIMECLVWGHCGMCCDYREVGVYDMAMSPSCRFAYSLAALQCLMRTSCQHNTIVQKHM